MRTHASIALFGLAAAVLGLGVALRDGGAALGQPAPAAAALRIATVDVYAVIEKVLQRPEYKKAQDDLKAKWDPKLEGLQSDFKKIDSDLQVLPQSDPKFQDVLKAGRDKQAEYDRAIQERQTEYEALSSSQLVNAYGVVRDAANKLATTKGYTHVFVNRPPERAINSTSLGNTLQEFLARPIIKSPAGDDLTKDVAADLKVELQ
jgi:Skp family chaperone for outer membrane proteins